MKALTSSLKTLAVALLATATISALPTWAKPNSALPPSSTTQQGPGVQPFNPALQKLPDLHLSNTLTVSNPNPATCSGTVKVQVVNFGQKASTPCTVNLTVYDAHASVQYSKDVQIGALQPQATLWVDIPLNVGHAVDYPTCKVTVDSTNVVQEGNEGNNVLSKVLFQ
ncbi:MAG: hypothetical protein EB084_20365 [Proteobacteria bacterium]|nr:hypothetical protein [Pseudomonadota bacterium]